jgi:hypothetical protein
MLWNFLKQINVVIDQLHYMFGTTFLDAQHAVLNGGPLMLKGLITITAQNETYSKVSLIRFT